MCSSGPAVKAALEAEGLAGLSPDHLDSGAPVLLNEDGSLSEYGVSVSDTRNFILVCVRKGPVGIDAEEKTRRVKASSAKALHPLEKRCLEGLEPESSEWRGEFLRIWTAKESYMKLCGEGLRMGLSSFSVVGEDLGYLGSVKKEGFPGADLYFAEGPSGLAVSACVPSGGGDLNLGFSRISCDFPPKTTALEKAAGLLDARDYSEAGLKKRLRDSGYSRDEAEEAGTLLKERG
ncbi:MAG: 4'-phosphopantetheinyl transferase superfamily protein, partial [Firmicutes bacterium]|nr:4'-phosphopantetheinyl transferase superfamily protein [Bacillota bacterium]